MSDHDPKIDPHPGDVLRRGCRTREITGRPELSGPWVSFVTPSSKKRRDSGFSMHRLEEFQRWAASAEVITKAGSEIRTGETK